MKLNQFFENAHHQLAVFNCRRQSDRKRKIHCGMEAGG